MTATLQIPQQPAANSSTWDRGVVSWMYVNGVPTILSRVGDPVWIGPPAGALAALPEGSRQIDLRRYPEAMRPDVQRALYAFLRHPMRGTAVPTFATLIKRNQAMLSLVRFLEQTGRTHLDSHETKAFLLDQARQYKHLESLTSLVATLKGLALYFERGYITLNVRFPFGSKQGAVAVAERIWREANGSDFQHPGIQPYADDDLALIVRNAHFYVEELAPHILTLLAPCLDIAEKYPRRRHDRSQESRCYREQMSLLASYDWPYRDSGFHEWPPQNMKELLGQARMCSAACAISCSFPTGARRSELVELADDCCTTDSQGRHLLEIVYMKGEDEKLGRPVKIPVDDMVARAVAVQLRIKEQVLRKTQGGKRSDPVTECLFVSFRDVVGVDQVPDDLESQEAQTLEAGRLSAFGLHALLRDFKARVVPDIEGSISFTRFRKSVARLLTLTMEGAPLTLQEIFGHDSYRTTLGYMFASPMIGDELVESHQELIAQNLRVLYQERAGLFGGGAAAFRAGLRSRIAPVATLTEPEIEMTENEFVELGLEMVRTGQMTLNLLGQGLYCLKPLFKRGPCQGESQSFLPNVGGCEPDCSHHLILGKNRPKLVRQVHSLDRRLADELTSPSMRKFFTAARGTLLNVLHRT